MEMHRYLQIATILFFSTPAFAFQPQIEIVEQFDRLRVVALAGENDVIASPEWNPNLSPIPLTVDQAIQAVRGFNNSSNTIGAIREIEIRQIPKYEKHWHYLIKVANEHMKAKYDIYVVLMNGKVIPGIIEPEGNR